MNRFPQVVDLGTGGHKILKDMNRLYWLLTPNGVMLKTGDLDNTLNKVPITPQEALDIKDKLE